MQRTYEIARALVNRAAGPLSLLAFLNSLRQYGLCPARVPICVELLLCEGQAGHSPVREIVELLVSEQHLDDADIGLLLQEVGGKAVPLIPSSE